MAPRTASRLTLSANTPKSDRARAVAHKDDDITWSLINEHPGLSLRSLEELPAETRKLSRTRLRRSLERLDTLGYVINQGTDRRPAWHAADRDGNPYVTSSVTRTTLQRNALASLRRYRDGVTALGRTLSLTERSLPVPATFKAELAQMLAESGDGAGATPGEVEDLVGPLLFLASDAASYVNGQAIAVDGGLSSSHPTVPGKFV